MIFLRILRNNMGCAVLLSLKEIRLVTCCTSFFFLVKELTGTGSEKYLKVWRPSMLALDSACGAPQGKINVYILKRKNPYENRNYIAVRMMSVHTLIYNRLLSET